MKNLLHQTLRLHANKAYGVRLHGWDPGATRWLNKTVLYFQADEQRIRQSCGQVQKAGRFSRTTAESGQGQNQADIKCWMQLTLTNTSEDLAKSLSESGF